MSWGLCSCPCCRLSRGPDLGEFADESLPPPEGHGYHEGDHTVVVSTTMPVFLRVNLTTGWVYEARVQTPLEIDADDWQAATADQRFAADAADADAALDVLGDPARPWPRPEFES